MTQAVYTHGHHDSVLRSHRWRTAENSAGYLLGDLAQGQALLDIGCGPGTITADLAALVAPGRVTAVDSAAGILDQARQVAADRGLDNVEFVVDDVHALTFAADSFDVVHAHQVLQHVHDPVQALREMRRVCRPDGLVAARDADYASMAWHPAIPALDEWLDLYREVARANDSDPDGGRRLLSWAQQAGFSEITPSASAWCYATPEERAWWGDLWAERMVSSTVAERALAGGHATEDDLRRISAGWREWAAAEDGWFGMLNGEVRCRP
ncbi:MAG: methyltransferase domain-containing protein [Streptosporangiales bacterium]|nr:methyltransferase domain-containing protein [Streptosporangiales bacterium]